MSRWSPQGYYRPQGAPRAPLGARRPRVRIDRHAVDDALRAAACRSHVCRPFVVPAPAGPRVPVSALT